LGIEDSLYAGRGNRPVPLKGTGLIQYH